jgi:hypothetical protein
METWAKAHHMAMQISMLQGSCICRYQYVSSSNHVSTAYDLMSDAGLRAVQTGRNLCQAMHSRDIILPFTSGRSLPTDSCVPVSLRAR